MRFYKSPKPAWLARRRARASHPDLLSPKLGSAHLTNKSLTHNRRHLHKSIFLVFQLPATLTMKLEWGEPEIYFFNRQTDQISFSA